MNLHKNTVILTLSKDSTFNEIKVSNEVSNFILNLEDLDRKLFKDIRNKLLTFGNKVKGLGGSFVVVSSSINDVDFDIIPSIQEAYDFIEMEEIEKQLNN